MALFHVNSEAIEYVSSILRTNASYWFIHIQAKKKIKNSFTEITFDRPIIDITQHIVFYRE
ncbi:hypothetical protein JHK85_042375 [Glycine max]|uniref:Uncharacterized protein n=1 Tax=Glycine soja TaxID=3848 RepID=A0A0B2QGL9_GLYSO|nr:hypothetical protein JHK85_042375 [Glycine max]KHN18927.1 hypothetical protein glysoja_036106 [Glycine soja]